MQQGSDILSFPRVVGAQKCGLLASGLVFAALLESFG